MITANDKVAAIRDAGYRVCISHRRRVRSPDGVPTTAGEMTARDAAAGRWVILTHGGETEVTVLVVTDHDPPRDVVVVASGRADCSTADRFEKRVGLELAVRRAIAGAPELRPIIAKLAAEKAAAA